MYSEVFAPLRHVNARFCQKPHMYKNIDNAFVQNIDIVYESPFKCAN